MTSGRELGRLGVRRAVRDGLFRGRRKARRLIGGVVQIRVAIAVTSAFGLKKKVP